MNSNTETPSAPSGVNCHICSKMAMRKGVAKHYQEPVRHCMLCNKMFCDSHKSPSQPTDGDGGEGVCEINHSTYYRKRPNKPDVYMSLEQRARVLGGARQ
ncbi:hypothetical protein BCR41DRAFT_363689 [Lobosporangium transversale]|uniref:Uncharacterized protein n=1 Tax=Lobosporangium transversale TaxID=64571 RepID=A0A1Y2G774_9FUNG|nr:hypothetical protein BCR41DRAFT_363689 [Lobosporangium transversale]ORY99749.1 hypothetical protein BCR41DRAFT_363689 [Lobosporangium transversale]|eukprot:XP_021875983.1 hypothetical protein BCR41DRAFT_363689 [Lobosporangium transversale]